MKIAKLVTGILSIVLSLFVLFQSCAAGAYNTLAENGESGGSAGLFVAICLIAAGIVSICTRSSTKKGGPIACAILYFIGAVMGFLGAGSYTDLYIWSIFAAICGVMHIVSAIKAGKNLSEQ